MFGLCGFKSESNKTDLANACFFIFRLCPTPRQKSRVSSAFFPYPGYANHLLSEVKCA